MNSYDRIVRASVLGGLAVTLSAWGMYAIDRSAWPGVALPLVVTVIAILNLVVTRWRPNFKVAAVRLLQRQAINPTVTVLLRMGINPLGVTLIETRGRASGLPRTTPVGVARDGDVVWLVAEHGRRAGYVRNIVVNPEVRLRVREHGHVVWRSGAAQLVPSDDPLARQRWMAGYNPLRWLNAMMVCFLGAELLSVRVATPNARGR